MLYWQHKVDIAYQTFVIRTGFRKIVKKWDKNADEKELEEFMTKVDTHKFSIHQELVDVISATQVSFVVLLLLLSLLLLLLLLFLLLFLLLMLLLLLLM